METTNPFQLQGYSDKQHFCDRKEELKFLKNAMANQRNVSIISIRRLGKTSLIKHLFGSRPKFSPVFVDIYRTRSQKEMVMRIIEECIAQLGGPSTTFLAKASKFLKSIELSMSFDPITGGPEISAGLRSGKEEALALAELFQYLDSQPKQVVIAIDEFQQILDYPEDNTEALLREHVQGLQNVTFIFCGSNKRMIQAIFTSHRRPFYQATEPLYLSKINSEVYADFIISHFAAADRSIDRATVLQGLQWCRVHTYYVQYLYNRLYSLGLAHYEEADLLSVQISILKERSPEYITLLNLLSPHQAGLLEAIAKEDRVKTPTSISFIIKHGLSAVSTVRQSLNVLLDKELLHEEGDEYMLTDLFLSRWLASTY